MKRGIQMKHEIFNRLGSMKNLALPSQFYLIKQTRQVKSLQTIIRWKKWENELLKFELDKFFFFFFLKRNRKTERDEFTFYSKRLMRILIEYALSLLPFEVKKRENFIEKKNERKILDFSGDRSFDASKRNLSRKKTSSRERKKNFIVLFRNFFLCFPKTIKKDLRRFDNPSRRMSRTGADRSL